MINIIRNVLICFLFMTNISYSQPMLNEDNFLASQSCESIISEPIVKEVKFGDLKLSVEAIEKSSYYKSKRTSVVLDVSQLARLQILTAYNMSDCQRWIEQERELCASSKEELKTSYDKKIRLLSKNYDEAVIENQILQSIIDSHKEQPDIFKVKVYSTSIGIIVGVVSSIVILKYF